VDSFLVILTGKFATMPTDDSTTIKCGLCDFALPANATICPNCGTNLSLVKLIERIPRVGPSLEPPPVKPEIEQPKVARSEKVQRNVAAPKRPAPAPAIAPVVASIKKPEVESGNVKVRKPPPDIPLPQDLPPPPPPSSRPAPQPVVQPVPQVLSQEVIEPILQPAPALENDFAAPQGYVNLLPAESETSSKKKGHTRGFSWAWVLSAVLLVGLSAVSYLYFKQSNQLRAAGTFPLDTQSSSSIQDESLTQAAGTIAAQQELITAQQNTIIAQQSPIVARPTSTADQTSQEKTLLVGPVVGMLVHNNDGLLKTYWAGENAKNFILSVVLVNPFPTLYHPWNTSIRFRRVYYDEYRLTIFSSQRWELTLGTSTEPLASGALTNLRMGEKELNSVYLEVRDGSALLKVNGEVVAPIDVSAYQESGDVGVAIGSRAGGEVDGKITYFQEFTLWSIP
jgi:hypothetical protein